MSQLTLKKPKSSSKQEQTDIPEVRPTSENMEDKQYKAHREDNTNNAEYGDKSHTPISSECYYNQNGNYIYIEESQLTEQILSFFPASREWRSAWSVSDNLGYPIDLVRKLIEANPSTFEISPIEPCGVKLYRPRKR